MVCFSTYLDNLKIKSVICLIFFSVFLLMVLNCSTGEDPWESPGQQGDQTSQSWRKSTLNIHWTDWCWSSNTLTAWCEEPMHWKRPWCWERLRAGGEESDKGWDGWMASLTQGHEFEQTLGDSEGQGNLASCSPLGHRESDTIQWLNNKTKYYSTKNTSKHI